MPSLFSHVRRGLAASVAAVLIGWALPVPAAAESTSIARVEREGVPGENVHFATGESATTTLFDLRVDDDTTVAAYCVDVSRNVDHRAAYAAAEWPDLPGAANAGEIVWIVRNSYPTLSLELLAAESGIDDLSAEQAIAGTQAAIWHLTNGTQLPTDSSDGRNSAQVRELYRYLLDNAVDSAEPDSALALSPTEVVGEASASLGPLTVHTTSETPVRLTVNGVREAALVDADGAPVTEARDGDEVLFVLPVTAEEGSATVYAHTEEAEVRPGLVYSGKDGVQTQPLVVAGTATASLTVSAKVSWNAAGPAETPDAPAAASPSQTAPSAPQSAPGGSAAPSPSPPLPAAAPVIAEDKRVDSDLPITGTWLGAVVAVALVLLGAGAVTILLARRGER
ncbi:thioester domain-containing protein [Thermobifida halotolerans]|uniref:Thioester domain-containing protein n=1 Tax=Thermobifida halotolerans TaxID=483545 RepID=A0A399G1V4_9ACTN|nr:thioester domain-containing protein [Thermobifida halotolerans]UOE19687.1 thioester domain-containing protein [Thermobifida halotolerans]